MAAALRGKTVSVSGKTVLPPPARVSQPAYWRNDGCLADQMSAVPAQCVFGDTRNPTMTVALVGDSMAGNWWAPLVEIADQEHWKLVTDLHGNCPLGSAPVAAPATTDGAYPECSEWAKTVMHDLVTTIRPRLVIASARQMPVPGYPDDAKSFAVEGAGEAAYWKQLQAHGMSVIDIAETPNLSALAPSCVEQYGATSSHCETSASAALPAGLPSQTVAKLSNVPVVNMNDLLCTRGECPSVIGNVLVYLDNHHLTQQYSDTLAPYLKQRLLATGAVPGHPRKT
jgi:hypothetical protein